MRIKYTIHYVSFLILGFVLYGNFYYLIDYLLSNSLEVAYSYFTYVGFVILPGGLVTGLLFVLLLFLDLKTIISRAYIIFWIGTFVITISLFVFLKIESKKVEVTIKNLSYSNIAELKVTARDRLVLSGRKLNARDSVIMTCKCRDPLEKIEKVGLKLSYFSQNGEKQFDIISPNTSIYRNKLEILIIGDTLGLVNSDIEDQWIVLNKGYISYSTKELDSLINRLHRKSNLP